MSWVVVPAAGQGARMAAALPKQYLPLGSGTVLQATLSRLASCSEISGLMLVLAEDDQHWPRPEQIDGVPLLHCTGGEQRSDSVLAGLRALPQSVLDKDWVLVHDAARPLLRSVDLSRLMQALEGADGALLGAPIRDTIKQVAVDHDVQASPSREGLWRAFTPQVFRRRALTEALQQAVDGGVAVTDEAMAMERCGVKPRIVEGSEDNLKITTPADLALAEFLLLRQS